MISERTARHEAVVPTDVNECVGPEQLGQSPRLDLVDHGRFQICLNRSGHVFVLATSDFLEVHREPLELLVLVAAPGDILSRLIEAVFLRGHDFSTGSHHSGTPAPIHLEDLLPERLTELFPNPPA